SPASSMRLGSQPCLVNPQQVIELPPPYEMPSLKRSGLGVFGWLLLAALLFGGVGALLYVALGERGERPAPKHDEASQPAPRVGGGGSDVQAQAPEPPKPGGNVKVVPEDTTASEGSGQSPPDDPDRKNDPKRPNARLPIKRPAPPVAVDNDPKALIRIGKQQEKSGDWEGARTTYQKLEKIKGYAGPALLLQASVALARNETDLAIQLAKNSAAQPGTHKTDAKFLYADALYKQGE